MENETPLSPVRQAAIAVLQKHQSKLAWRNGSVGAEIIVKDFVPPQEIAKSDLVQEIADALHVFTPSGAHVTSGNSAERNVLAVYNADSSLREQMESIRQEVRGTDSETPELLQQMNSVVPDLVGGMLEKLSGHGIKIQEEQAVKAVVGR